MTINELEIKLNLYDEICREFYEKNGVTMNGVLILQLKR